MRHFTHPFVLFYLASITFLIEKRGLGKKNFYKIVRNLYKVMIESRKTMGKNDFPVYDNEP